MNSKQFTEICICHNCNTKLSYNPLYHNIYDGGPYYCGVCGVDVTEDIYSKQKEKSKDETIKTE